MFPPIRPSATGTYTTCCWCRCSTSRAFALLGGGAGKNSSIISRPIKIGWPCTGPLSPTNSGTIAHTSVSALRNLSRSARTVPGNTGGRSPEPGTPHRSHSVQHLLQTHLDRTELSSLRLPDIVTTNGVVAINHDGTKVVGIAGPTTTSTRSQCGLQRVDHRSEEGVFCHARAHARRRPRQQRLVPPHAGGGASGQNDSADTSSLRHVSTIPKGGAAGQ